MYHTAMRALSCIKFCMLPLGKTIRNENDKETNGNAMGSYGKTKKNVENVSTRDGKRPRSQPPTQRRTASRQGREVARYTGHCDALLWRATMAIVTRYLANPGSA